MKESVPKLRKDIELFPTYYQAERGVLVRDPLGLIKEPIFLRGEIIELMSLIDGKRNIRDIQIELMRQKRGILISSEEVMQLLSERRGRDSVWYRLRELNEKTESAFNLVSEE